MVDLEGTVRSAKEPRGLPGEADDVVHDVRQGDVIGDLATAWLHVPGVQVAGAPVVVKQDAGADLSLGTWRALLLRPQDPGQVEAQPSQGSGLQQTSAAEEGRSVASVHRCMVHEVSPKVPSHRL